ITDWFCDDKRPDLIDNLKKLKSLNEEIDACMDKYLYAMRSTSSVILELDGITFTMKNESARAFCEIRNTLNYYQKATKQSLVKLRREAYIEFQRHAPLDNGKAWDDLASESFDGFELFDVLSQY